MMVTTKAVAVTCELGRRKKRSTCRMGRPICQWQIPQRLRFLVTHTSAPRKDKPSLHQPFQELQPCKCKGLPYFKLKYERIYVSIHACMGFGHNHIRTREKIHPSKQIPADNLGVGIQMQADLQWRSLIINVRPNTKHILHQGQRPASEKKKVLK